MPLETGIWTQEEAATGHDFSYMLAKFIGEYFHKAEPLCDFGCGQATYLRYLHDIGFTNLHGYEGTEQNFHFGHVTVCDVTKPISCKVDNVICLEVGEHIPEEYLDVFIDNLAQARKKVFLSWGIPGQDGIGHISCKHNIWVINEFEKRGFKLLSDDSLKARAVVEERLNYFRNTIMIFEKR